jgi:hypothetical protein
MRSAHEVADDTTLEQVKAWHHEESPACPAERMLAHLQRSQRGFECDGCGWQIDTRRVVGPDAERLTPAVPDHGGRHTSVDDVNAVMGKTGEEAEELRHRAQQSGGEKA